MDLEAIKVLLDSQAKTFHTAMDFVAEQFKSRIQEAEITIQDLTRSLEFSQAEVKDLQSEVREFKKFASESKTNSEVLKAQIKELEQRQNYQEDYNRRNNLRISGIEEKPSESWEETANSVSKLIEEKLQLPTVSLERAHRTGPASSSRSRVVIARFEKFSEREAVIRNARKLKGTNIFIDEDLCPASLEIRRSQMPLMKKAREEGKVAFFRHTRLIIKDKSSNYQPLGGSYRSEDVSSRAAVGVDTGAMADGDSSVSGKDAVSTHGVVGDVTGAVVRAAEAGADGSSVGAEGGSSGRSCSAPSGSSGVGDGDGGPSAAVGKRRVVGVSPMYAGDGRPPPARLTLGDVVGGGVSPGTAPAQRPQQSARTKNRKK